MRDLFGLSRLGSRVCRTFATSRNEHLELPIEELFKRAHLLSPYEETRIDDLTEEEETAFVAALGE